MDRCAFAFFLLVTGVLLLRPADLVPGLAGLPLYELSLLGCLGTALPRLLGAAGARGFRPSAIVALVILLVPAVVLSHLSHLNTWDARLSGLEAAKACVLFLLAVGLLDTPARLRLALLAAMVSVLGMTVLALADYHGLVDVPSMESVVQHGIDGESSMLRLCGTGVFNDPNDFALMLIVCLGVCGYATTQGGVWRWASPVAFTIFAYALVLTHSRGGFMAAVAAAAGFLVFRFGWKNSVPLLVLVGIAALAPVWGRQTSLNLQDPDDTFQARLDLWSSSLDAFRAAPLLGVGQGKLTDMIGQVTHNSYLHAFAEMGFFGGVVFLGVFTLIVRGLWQVEPSDATMARLRPFVAASVLGYAAGLLALSRCYTVPTQLILALGTAFLLVAWRDLGVDPPRLTAGRVGRLSGLGLVFLGATYIFVRFMLRRGA